MAKTDKFESEDYASLKSEIAIKEAKENGGKVVFPGTAQLQIDLDSEEAFEAFERCQPILEWLIGVSGYTKRPSRTKGRWHITVNLYKPVMSDMERISLQACLGSDPKRELLSYARVLSRDPHPTLFIEGGVKPGQGGRK